MPVIIQEIHITAEVGSQPQAQTGAEPPPAAPAASQASIVAACVEEVLRIIHEKAER
jgi:hypothetical protein